MKNIKREQKEFHIVNQSIAFSHRMVTGRKVTSKNVRKLTLVQKCQKMSPKFQKIPSYRSRSMSDPHDSDIDFKNLMTWVYPSLMDLKLQQFSDIFALFLELEKI